MAAPDLTAQKSLATNPDQGFGESVVLPYRPRGFDYAPYQFLQASQARAADEAAARKKRDLDLFQTLKRPSNETKGNVRLQDDYNKYSQHLANKLSNGEDLSPAEIVAMGNDLAIKDAQDKDAHAKYDMELTQAIPDNEKAYGKAYMSGLATQKSIDAYHDQPLGKFNHTSNPLEDTELYDLPTAGREFANNFQDIYNQKYSREDIEEDPEKATTVKTSTGAVFMIRDPETGVMVPGVGETHVDEFLNEKNGVAKVKIQKDVVTPEFQQDAKTIMKNAGTDPSLAKFVGKTEPEVLAMISESNPLKGGKNVAAYTRDIAKKQLEAYNSQSKNVEISNEKKQPKEYDPSTGSNYETKFLATEGTFSHASATSEPVYTTDAQGNVTKTVTKTSRFSIPGVNTTTNGQTLKPVQINPKQYRDLSTGRVVSGLQDRVDYTPQHIGTAVMDENGRAVAMEPDMLAASIRKAADEYRAWVAGGKKGEKPKGYEGWSVNRVSSGYIDTKLNSEGKSPDGLTPSSTDVVVSKWDPEQGKNISVIRKTVTIPLQPGDDVESALNAQSGGTLRSRKLTPQEQALEDAMKYYKQSFY